MLFYLVRHAQSEGNAKGFFQGNIDTPLTPLGHRQAAFAADWLAGQEVKPDAVYTSPLCRAATTAEAITKKLGLPPATPMDELREFRGGELEGLMPDEIHAKYAHYENRKLNERGDFSVFGGESYEEMQARLKKFIAAMEAKHKEDDVIMAVSHGGAIYQLLKLWCAWPTPRHFFAYLGNCTCLKLRTREISGVKAAELQWMVPLELMGWHANGGQAGAGRTDWVERR